MPILYDGRMADLTGHCAPEEADGLLDWLQLTAGAAIRLTDCESLHTALLQVLLALRPEIRELPADPALRRWLGQFVPVSVSVPSLGE